MLAGGAATTRSTAAAASTSTSARPATTRSRRATATPSGSRAAPAPTRRDNDFVDIIAECERGIDADGDGFSSAVDCNDGAAAHLPRRAPRSSTTASTRTATAATTPTSTSTATASRARSTATTPTPRSGRRAGDPRQQGRRELRQARRAVRATSAPWWPTSGCSRAASRACASSSSTTRPRARASTFRCTGRSCPFAAHAAAHRPQRPRARHAAPAVPAGARCAPARSCG